jgi:uncharacterized protein
MKAVRCTIYKGAREEGLYLYLEHGAEFKNVPEALLKRMGSTSEVMTILIDSEKKLARVQASQVLKEIEEKGFFLQLPPQFNPQLNYGE